MADFSLPDEYVQNATATVAPAAAAPAAFTLPNDVVSKAVDEYKVDPNYNPHEAALQAQPGSPEWEHAFLVNQAREGMTSAEKKKYGLEPSTSEKLKNAGAGAVQFGVGLVAAPVLGTASIIAQNPSLYKKAINVGSAAVGVPTNLNDEAGPLAKKLQSDSVLAAEKATNPIARAFSDFSKWYERNSPIYDDNPSTDSLSMEGDQFAPKPKDVKLQQARDDFANAVQRYKEDKGLEQGRVQDTGAFAEAAKGVGFAPSDAALTPERQKELGVETSPTEKYLVDAASTAENPENALFALAPEVPGVAAGLKAAGTGLEFVGKGAAKVASKIPVAAKATGGALGVAGVGYELYQHPIEATAGLGLAGTLMLMRPAGTFIRGAGELAGGMAPAEGASALGLRAKQMLAGGVGGSVIGAATSPEDPEQGAYSGFAMGAGGGALHSPYGAQVAGKRAAMEQFGDSIRTGNDAVDTTHQAIVGKFDPAAKAALDRYRAAAIADGTHLVVTDQAGFNAAMQANGQPDANGVRGVTVGDDKHILTNGPNGSRTIYINADTVGGESGFKGVDTAGHELGHAVVDYLKAQSSKAAADALTQAVSSNLTDAEKSEIASKYGQAINAQTTNAPVSPVDENIAEITRKLLAKKDISEFGLPETLVQKIKGSVSDFFEGTRGDGGGMKWGTKEIVKARRLIEKALYDQGSRATAMRQRASDVAAGKVEPNIIERQKQIAARISEIDGLDQTQVTPSILEERAKLTKQASDLASAEAARTGQTPATPSTGPTIPTAPTGPTKNDLLTVKSALVAMGYPARVSEQMAQAAQGGTVEELIKDALARKQPTPISPQTAPATPAQTAAPAVPAPNVGTLTPQTTQGSGQGVAAVPTGQLSGFAAPAATATAEAPALAAFDPNAKPTQSPTGTNLPPSVPPVSPGDVATGATPSEPAGVARPVSSPEEVSAAVGAATAAAQATPEYERALKKKEKAKAANDPATEAQADARLETLEREARLDALKKLLPRHEQGSGPAPDELHVSADNFGNESIKGKIDESNPVHREIMAHGEMSPEEIARVKQLQDKTGAISYIDYGSAAKEDNVRRHGEQRRTELAASPAQERVEGVGEITEQKNKAVIPVGNTVTAAGRVNTVALSPDKILSNLGSVVRAATEHGLPNGDFSGRPEALNNLAIYLRNHRNGFSGDGITKVDPTIAPNAKGESLVDAHGQPVDLETAEARMRVFNMAMHDTRATAPARAEAKQAAYTAAMQAWTDGGEQGPKPRKPRELDPKTKFQAEEGQALAKRYGAMDETNGETNPLRADLEKAGYDTAKELESPWENLRPELIRDIRDAADGKQEIVRPHRVAPEDIAGAVTNPPSGKATLAGFMPDEPSIKSKEQLFDFKTDKLGFYSGLGKIVDDKLPNKATGEQILGILKNNGAKAEEMEAMGLPEFLQGRKGVTKQEIQDFVDAGGVKLKEVTKAQSVSPKERAQLEADIAARADEIHESKVDDAIEQMVDRGEDEEVIDRADVSNSLDYNESEREAREELEPGDETKFSQYTLPGGKNYKEVVLTLPQESKPKAPLEWKENASGKWAWFQGDRQVSGAFPEESQAEQARRSISGDVNRPEGFQSSHFPNEEGYLAHLRTADHTDTQGRDGMVIEEIQSDLHQKGRKEGYNDAASKAKADALREEASALMEKANSIVKPQLGGSLEKFREFIKGGGNPDSPEAQAIIDAIEPSSRPEEVEELLKQAREKETEAAKAVGPTPDAPFKKTWHELAFKRALRMAVESGKDFIGWVDGKTQAERYDLSKQVDNIEYSQLQNGNYEITATKDGQEVHSGDYPADKLSDVVGKEVAEKIVSGEGEEKKYSGSDVTYKSLSGDDLKVGGAGMKAFYDKMLPDFVRNYVKKWGGKVESTELPDDTSEGRVELYGDSYRVRRDGVIVGTFDSLEKAEKVAYPEGKTTTVHSVTITPAMREAVMKGQPLFMPDAERGASPEGKKPLEDFRPEGAGMQPSIKSKVALANFMPGEDRQRIIQAYKGPPSVDSDTSPSDFVKFVNAKQDVLSTVSLPPGWSLSDETNFHSKWGTAYYYLRDPAGDTHKLRIGDHPPNPDNITLRLGVPEKDATLNDWSKAAGKVEEWAQKYHEREFAEHDGDLSRFMPSDFSGRNEVNVKDRSEETDFSPAAMKQRRLADFVAQKPWLDEQAQQLGYEDSDALNAADSDKFNALAEQWRAEHPREDAQGRQLFMPEEEQGKYKNPELRAGAKPKEIAIYNTANEIKRALFRAGLLDQSILEDLDAPGDLRDYRKADIESALEAAGDRRSYDEILSGNKEHLKSNPKHRVKFTQGDNADIFDWAVQAHGVTDDPNQAGYILPDGRMLDFSESRHGGGGSRSADHRQIQYPGREGEGYKAMRGFMEAGAVRMDANSGAIDIAKKPTPEQERLIRRVIEEAGQGYIDVTDGDRRASFEVDADAVGKVMGRIKRFYAGEDFEGGQLFMPGDQDAQPKRTWFMRDGKRVYHQRHPDSGQFVPKQTLARFQPGSVQSSSSDKQQLADFAP